MKFKNLLLDNILIKFFSLIFAIILWFYVASKGKGEVSLVIPLELKNVPASMVSTGDVIDRVDVRVSGRHSILSGLDQNQIIATLDLSGALPGENTFYLTLKNFNLPSAVEILRIDPKVVKIRLEPLTFQHPGSEGKPHNVDKDKSRQKKNKLR